MLSRSPLEPAGPAGDLLLIDNAVNQLTNHSLNMNATSAATVPLAGSPDSRTHSRSSQLRMKGSVTVDSITREKG